MQGVHLGPLLMQPYLSAETFVPFLMNIVKSGKHVITSPPLKTS